MLALAAAPSLAFAIPAAVLVGVSSIAFMTSSTATVQVRAAPEFRGRVLAIQSMVFLGSTPIGGPTIGWIADVAGPRMAIVVGALGCAAAAIYGARALHVGGRGVGSASDAGAGTESAILTPLDRLTAARGQRAATRSVGERWLGLPPRYVIVACASPTWLR